MFKERKGVLLELKTQTSGIKKRFIRWARTTSVMQNSPQLHGAPF